MLFVVLVYNFMLFGLDLLALMIMARQKSRLSRAVTVGGHLAAAVILAVLLAGPSFTGLNLMTYGLFFHVPFVLLCVGVFFFRGDRWLSIAAFTVASVLVATAIDAFWVEPHWLDVTHHRLKTSKLSRPLRIAVVADLQTDQLTGYEREVFKRLAAESPDLVLFAGDYLQAGRDDWFTLAAEYRGFFKEIDLSAPLGVYAVGGNTDHPRWPEIFSDVAANAITETSDVQLGQIQITQLSVSDSFDTQKFVAPADRFHIVLGHAPDFSLGEVNADLLVAGHTHGGQVQIPYFGPLLTMSAVPRSWAVGVTQLSHDRTLAVSRGIGMERGDAPRIRFFCRPELMILDLEPVSDVQATIAPSDSTEH